MENQAVPVKAFDARLGNVRGRTILVQGEDAYELDEVGTEIWRLCDGRRTTLEIAAAVADKFDGPRDEVVRDTSEYLGNLVDLGLVEREQGN